MPCPTVSEMVQAAWRDRKEPIPVILFNGPPRSGKDTAAGAVCSKWRGVQAMKFATPVKNGTHAVFGLDVPADHYEAVKDERHDDFGGLTPRQAYIDFSEKGIKPVFGAKRFGATAARLIVESGAEAVVISDSGFDLEAECVARRVGRDNVLLVRIHAPGRGCTFKNDSRGHISLPGVETHDLTNDGTPEAFREVVIDTASAWLRPRYRKFSTGELVR